MKPRHLYAALCIPGALLPWWQFLPWVAQHGANARLFFRHLFANGVSGAFALDLIVTAAAVCALILVEGRRLGLRYLWAPIAGTFIIGVSFGLPLFLFMRQRQLDRTQSQ
ncbi:MAG: DUF2834 domain-containing protein [Chthoniobacterales bacterium]